MMQIVHTHAPLAEVEREWEVGMRLNQLAEEDGSLPGFMGVGAGNYLWCCISGSHMCGLEPTFYYSMFSMPI